MLDTLNWELFFDLMVLLILKITNQKSFNTTIRLITYNSAYKNHFWAYFVDIHNQLINEAELNSLHIFWFNFTIICHHEQQTIVTVGLYKQNSLEYFPYEKSERLRIL